MTKMTIFDDLFQFAIFDTFLASKTSKMTSDSYVDYSCFFIKTTYITSSTLMSMLAQAVRILVPFSVHKNDRFYMILTCFWYLDTHGRLWSL